MTRSPAAKATFLIAALLLACNPATNGNGEAAPQEFDVVFQGARVIDPERRLDEVRNVGIRGDVIAALTEDSLAESLADGGRLSPVQEGFHMKLGAQCGACTPGFVMATEGLLRANPNPTDDDIREALGSNICRCTGYVKIIEAVHYAADKMREKAA